jgi:LPPG:FO 2-phospho-L-lactate transferase
MLTRGRLPLSVVSVTTQIVKTAASHLAFGLRVYRHEIVFEAPIVRVAALAGGVGGAKLLRGLDRAIATDPAGDSLTAIVNTGDDSEIYGVHVSPDVDIVTYWLAGIADYERGWGIAGDTFTVVDSIAKLGGESWFRLGDRDFATCIHRSQQLLVGMTLTAVTDEIRRSLGARPAVIPMSNDRVRTQVVSAEGAVLDFQEYFVKLRTEPEVVEVRYEGIDAALPAPGVLDAIENADVVVVCPSNPVLSIAPILGLKGVRDALVRHKNVVAVSPIVQGRALKGPADRLLKSLGGDPSATGAAGYLAGICDLFVVDATDEAEIAKVEALGMKCAAMDTIMSDASSAERLARELLQGTGMHR